MYTQAVLISGSRGQCSCLFCVCIVYIDVSFMTAFVVDDSLGKWKSKWQLMPIIEWEPD